MDIPSLDITWILHWIYMYKYTYIRIHIGYWINNIHTLIPSPVHTKHPLNETMVDVGKFHIPLGSFGRCLIIIDYFMVGPKTMFFPPQMRDDVIEMLWTFGLHQGVLHLHVA